MEKKKLFRIGTVAKLLGLKTYVLRFWETQYPQLVPLRSETGQRLYSEKQIALLGRIKQLIREQGMTTAGVRRVLSGRAVDDLPPLDPDSQEMLLAEEEGTTGTESDADADEDVAASGTAGKDRKGMQEALQHEQAMDAICTELHEIRTLLLRNEEGT